MFVTVFCCTHSLAHRQPKEVSSQVSAWAVGGCIILVIVGTLARLASGFAIVACSPLQLREQFVVVWSLIPKATVQFQAALGPNLLVSAEEFPEYQDEALFVRFSTSQTV
ncbi:hypothetical protein ANCDUO_02885 [Ancylostoma duodenale]|uniref:Uncharacterized protein n=1 Tax=Ancylostoma duodenale TaxID=51022 RepID=A0A0C2H5G5_9BILA|nr:hypothetical protein ANCDUO_02885 [Ancylostoma duodenale]